MDNRSEDQPFVLFADDDTDVLRLMELYVGLYNWKADYAADARTMLDMVNSNCCVENSGCYDLIVADVNFMNPDQVDGPRISGITAGREIRKVHPDVPIVFVTAYNVSLIRTEAKRINAYIISKPVDYQEMFKWFKELADFHKKNHSADQGISVSGVDWHVGDIHASTDEKLSVPKRLEDSFKYASLKAGLRPTWSI